VMFSDGEHRFCKRAECAFSDVHRILLLFMGFLYIFPLYSFGICGFFIITIPSQSGTFIIQYML
jgi:hypothetical protein